MIEAYSIVRQTDPNTNKGESTPDGQASDEMKGNIKNTPSVNPTLHGKINELKNALKENIKKQIEKYAWSMKIGREHQMHLWAPIVMSLNPHVVLENNDRVG